MLHGFLLSWLVGITLAQNTSSPRAITEADSIIAVFTQDWGLASAGSPKLILTAWPDGYVVWSEDRIRGGEPYFAGQVARARVSAVFDRVTRDGGFDDERLAQACFGPDASFTSILFRHGEREVKMDSWHEMAEAEGRTVARSCGLSALSSERRLAVVKKEPAEFLYYRLVWSELRGLASSLLPPESHPVAGEVRREGGALSWHEAKPR